MAVEFELNGKTVNLDVDPAMPLLWAIRDIAGLTGTKYGCGKALCGACTIHINGQPMRSKAKGITLPSVPPMVIATNMPTPTMIP